MGIDTKDKNARKMGARTLSKNEISLILPTYVKIIDQIETIRKDNKPLKNQVEASSHEEQKINNIGVMGARGTGKTSVIKTLIKQLEDENKNSAKNITLPLIVPENMSESVNLMATILGLFKEEVEKIKKKNGNNATKCWEQKPLEVVKLYDDLIKKYCYVQDDYRKVIISQYTTEGAYIKKSAEVFNSDVGFMQHLNKFINKLLKDDMYSEDVLLFLFVDDIDLSTHRCVDVVKTLLSYLSHPRIVTIISGDLDTFEEALTLDFIRRESIPDTAFLAKNFINNSKNAIVSLLESRKILSYEYLKKILPPVYRHNVKAWGLHDRPNYCHEVEKNQSAGSLVDLLDRALGEFGWKNFFRYYHYSYADNAPADTLKNMPQMFCIFDDTSRGLNNVYNVLLDLCDVLDDKEAREQKRFTAVKLFLETVISSNRVLNSYRGLLLEETINFGTSIESTVVLVNNFFHGLYIDEKDGAKESNINAKERFTLSVFLELAIRMLRKSDLLGETVYKKVRGLAIRDLVNNPIISGRNEGFDEKITIADVENNLRARKDDIFIVGIDKKFTTTFLLDADFTVALCFFQYINEFNHSLANDGSKSLYEKVYFAFLSNAEMHGKDIGSILTDNIDKYKNLLSWIVRSVQEGDIQTVVSELYKSFLNNVKMKFEAPSNEKVAKAKEEIESYLSYSEQKKAIWNYCSAISFETILYPTTCYLVNLIEKKLFDNKMLMSLESRKSVYIDESLLGEGETNKSNEKKKREVVIAIDSSGEWRNAYAESAKKYIDSNLSSYEDLFNTYTIKVDISNFQESYKEFQSIYKGGYSTNANIVFRVCDNIVNEGYAIKPEEYIILIQIIHYLSFSSSWYGVVEARNMYRQLKKSSLHITPNEFDEEDALIFALHSYARMKVSSEGDVAAMYKLGNNLSIFASALYAAFNTNDRKEYTSFSDNIAKHLDSVSAAEIEEIFGVK